MVVVSLLHSQPGYVLEAIGSATIIFNDLPVQRAATEVESSKIVC